MPGTPLPQAQAFVVCQAIYQDQRTGNFVLIAPFSGTALSFFPDRFRLSVYAHLTSGHGSYYLELQLLDVKDEIVWRSLPAARTDPPPKPPGAAPLHAPRRDPGLPEAGAV